MRKRSKYRPRGVLLNPMGFVLESLTPVRAHASIALDLRIKNHNAMTALTTGVATREDIDTLVAALNVTEALYRLGFGKEYGKEVHDALAALRAVGNRGWHNGMKFILKSAEMLALNTALELHDAQLDVITLKDLERALHIVQEEMRTRKATPIVTPKEKQDV